ncbi:MAG: hypothetical protein K0S45_1672 [Nitrospira sp.]|jgi:hypothetical protein|nr:hypothetical protein [Nitrospira sp.]
MNGVSLVSECKKRGVQRAWHGLRWALIVVLVGLFSTDVEAGRIQHDFSGDAMQRYDSRMMSSPVMRFPGLFGISLWPYIVYPPAPSLTIVNVQIQIPELDQRPAPASTPPPSSRFWIARCGVFVELEVSSSMNLMQEERKTCSP